MASKVDVGPVQVAPQVSVGKPTIDSQTKVTVGPASIDANQQPKDAYPCLLEDGTTAFKTLWEVSHGDPILAESFVPGITNRDGALLLRKGPDGRPHVKVPLENHAKFLEAHARHQSDQAMKAEPEFFDDQTMYNYVQNERPDLFNLITQKKISIEGALHVIYDGSDGPDGYAPFMQEDKDGNTRFRNPKHAETSRITARVRANREAQARREAAIKRLSPDQARRQVNKEYEAKGYKVPTTTVAEDTNE